MDSVKFSIRFQQLPDIAVYILYDLGFIDIVLCEIEKAIGINTLSIRSKSSCSMYEANCRLPPALLYVSFEGGAKSMCISLCIYQVGNLRF